MRALLRLFPRFFGGLVAPLNGWRWVRFVLFGMGVMTLFKNDLWAQPQWELISLQDTSVRFLVAHPRRSSELFAGVELQPNVFALLRSNDYAENWDIVIPPDSLPYPLQLSFDTYDSNRVVCSGRGTFLHSEDAGLTWSRQHVDLNISPNAVVVAVHSAFSPGVMILMVAGGSGNFPLHRSEDYGQTFEELIGVYPTFGPVNLFSFGSHPNDIWLSGTGRLSTDGGVTWGAPDDSLSEFWTLDTGYMLDMPYYGVLVRLTGPNRFTPYVATRLAHEGRWNLLRPIVSPSTKLAVHPFEPNSLVMAESTYVTFSNNFGTDWTIDSLSLCDSLLTGSIEFSADGSFLYRGMYQFHRLVEGDYGDVVFSTRLIARDIWIEP